MPAWLSAAHPEAVEFDTPAGAVPMAQPAGRGRTAWVAGGHSRVARQAPHGDLEACLIITRDKPTVS